MRPKMLCDLNEQQHTTIVGTAIVGTCSGNHRLHCVRAYVCGGKTHVGKSLAWLVRTTARTTVLLESDAVSVRVHGMGIEQPFPGSSSRTCTT
jgi:hypothetical protein